MRILQSIPLLLALVFMTNCSGVTVKPARLAESKEKALQHARHDGEIIAFLESVNKYEVEAAKELLKSFHGDDVRSFAEFMIKEHGANLKEAQKLSREQRIPPVETEMIASLKEKTGNELAFLKPLKGVFLDKAYIDAMVSGHEEVLRQIDSYLKDVNNHEIKMLLEKTKLHVEHHLEMAKAIQQEQRKS